MTGGLKGEAHIWDAEAKKVLLPIDTHGRREFDVLSAAISPDGNDVALGTNDAPEYLKIYDAHNGKLVWQYCSDDLGHKNAILSLAYSRDGKRLLSTSYDATIRLWDLEKRSELRSLQRARLVGMVGSILPRRAMDRLRVAGRHGDGVERRQRQVL